MTDNKLARKTSSIKQMVRPSGAAPVSALGGGTILPLPASREECVARGWDQVDVVLISGDAYIDHPSFGIALIGRLLESHGYRVAILAQPRYDRLDDFLQFGPPRLFWGISGGNLDSIVANYSGNGKVRTEDAYSPGGNPWRDGEKGRTNRRRPDRASLIYANLARAACKGVPIILGGVEASLRRFIHYDYQQGKLRASLLTDAKGDLLIYGMGERAVVEAAARLAAGKGLDGIAGSCERLTEAEFQSRFPDLPPKGNETCLILPSWEAIGQDKRLFMEAERMIDSHARGCLPSLLVQRQQSAWLIQHPAAPPLTTAELDQVYELPYSRKPHPATPDIPAYRMICHSLTIVRGCSGNCSFCAITRHQGPIISSRSPQSILREARIVSAMDNFTGVISDLGGPTANLYRASCKVGSCRKHDCLYPKICPNLQVDEQAFLNLLRDISMIAGVNHVFISSGLRMELLLKTPRLLQEIIRSHTPGAMKIAPEHTEERVLTLMHKESHQQLVDFLHQCRQMAAGIGKKIIFTPYLISSHPGCTARDTEAMTSKLRALDLHVKQFQDFTPTPGTLSTAMYVTGLHRDTNQPIPVARNQSERKEQRGMLERQMVRPEQRGKPTSVIKKDSSKRRVKK
ncbi:MAG: YgiQ family radical SAM protein [Desulfocapsaceae bacterium]|nr:YgiQ family radical SAM protein [Desulfocapsaceae bacterium]